MQDLGEAIERPVEILRRNHQRGRQPHHRLVRLLRQHALVEQPLAGFACARDLGIDLGADPEATSAHLAGEAYRHRDEPLLHIGAELGRAFDELLLLDDGQRFMADCGGECVAAEGRAVRAGREHVHQRALADERRDRQHAAAQRLAENEAVGDDAFVLEREPGAGAPKAGLHLVDDQEHVVGVADPAQPREEARGRHDDAGLALDRLDQDSGSPRRDRPLDGGEIAERHSAESGGEGTEAVAIVGLGRERDHGGGAAVEVALGNDDLGAVALDAFDPIAPAARRLDRGLDRLRAGVHRQRGVEPRELAELLEEGTETIVVVGARRHSQTLGLGRQRVEDAGMGVAVAGGRIGAHHVDVAPARRIEEVRALSACQHHRERLVVVRTVAVLELDGFHGTDSSGAASAPPRV